MQCKVLSRPEEKGCGDSSGYDVLVGHPAESKGGRQHGMLQQQSDLAQHIVHWLCSTASYTLLAAGCIPHSALQCECCLCVTFTNAARPRASYKRCVASLACTGFTR
jgi:hypothetical protein